MRVRPIVLPGEAEFELFRGEIGRYDGITIHQQFSDAIEAMHRQHIPPGVDGNYVMFAHPSVIEQYRAAARTSRRKQTDHPRVLLRQTHRG